MHAEKKDILVIDDNPEIHDLVERTLQGTEFSLLKAEGGREGIHAAKEHSPAVILLDIMMPDFDGFMTGKVLKRNNATKHIPVIFLSAKKTKEDINKAIQAGGSDYITKPFSPSDLLTRLRRTVETTSIRTTKKSGKNKEDRSSPVTPHEGQSTTSPIDITFHDNVAVISTRLKTLRMENCRVYRDAIANVIDNGTFRIVLDSGGLEAVDGTGLALLLSTKESLDKYEGGLRLIFPPPEIKKPFSFLSLSDLFWLENDIPAAIRSFHETESEAKNTDTTEALNVCLSCTFVNPSKARYCGYCGSNLVLGKGEGVLSIITGLLSKRILAETNSNDRNHINRQRKFEEEGYTVPSDFMVEIEHDTLKICYKSSRTDARFFESHERIGIQAPVIGTAPIPLRTGMNVRLANPHVGEHSMAATSIESIDADHGMIYVTYNEDALALHSMKNFSVAPKNPFTVQLTVPTLKHAGIFYSAKILELNRVRMVVFADKELPLHRCLSLDFSLPGDVRITSPLAVAQKGRQRYMYHVEFRLIDEKESTMITKYMYRRQIELAKGDKT